MKLLQFIPLLSLPLALAEIYPQLKNAKPPHLTPYEPSQRVPVSCIQRQIDSGEHKFDGEGNIIYSAFPVCRETGESFSLSYNTPGIQNCTIELTDEVYHLFQLYIHQDVPFSCRLPYSKTQDVYIPFTLNFRGIIETSHLDIDTTMNVLVHGTKDGAIISSVGYSAGGNVSRYIIGDFMPIRFHVQWIDEFHATDDNGHYDVHMGHGAGLLLVVGALGLIIGGVVIYVVMYGVFNRRLVKNLGYKPGGFATELGIEKRD